jgi:hypothetical protein
MTNAPFPAVCEPRERPASRRARHRAGGVSLDAPFSLDDVPYEMVTAADRVLEVLEGETTRYRLARVMVLEILRASPPAVREGLLEIRETMPPR